MRCLLVVPKSCLASRVSRLFLYHSSDLIDANQVIPFNNEVLFLHLPNSYPSKCENVSSMGREPASYRQIIKKKRFPAIVDGHAVNARYVLAEHLRSKYDLYQRLSLPCKCLGERDVGSSGNYEGWVREMHLIPRVWANRGCSVGRHPATSSRFPATLRLSGRGAKGIL